MRIEPWPVSRRLGGNAPCIVIDCDGEDRAIELSEPIAPYETLDQETLFQKILQGGIVGLGPSVARVSGIHQQALTETQVVAE